MEQAEERRIGYELGGEHPPKVFVQVLGLVNETREGEPVGGHPEILELRGFPLIPVAIREEVGPHGHKRADFHPARLPLVRGDRVRDFERQLHRISGGEVERIIVADIEA